MSAIVPHLEQPHETTPIERQFYRCIAGEPNMHGAFADGSQCPSPQQIIAKNHQELLAMVYVRNAVEHSLLGRRFVVQNGKPQYDAKTGREKLIDQSTIYLVLDGPIGEGPPWNPAASPDARSYNLLTWTSKMNAPSFSIPAGAPAVGGTCPGATGGQSAVPNADLVSAERLIRSVTGERVDLSRSICNFCYATGGQYGTGGVQFAQALRHIWVREAIRQPIDTPLGRSTLFIETMVAAIQNANFYINGGMIKNDKETGEESQKLGPEFSGRRFFRIHDSGDFFAPEYLAQWKAICDRLPDITFWAPSRVWALGKPWIDAVNQINGQSRNLVIRPSAYHIDGPCPVDLGPGWAHGSTVYSHEAGGHGIWHWQCDAYATGSNRTCRGALAPPGLGDPHSGRGCRACWIAPQLTINYSPH